MPNRMQELFTRVPDKDCKLLWMDVCNGRLENMILSTLLVLPIPICPSITMEGGSNKDNTTVKMQEILGVNHTFPRTGKNSRSTLYLLTCRILRKLRA